MTTLAPATETPDEHLVHAARHGDPEAVAELYRRHHDVARALAMILVRCPDAADDVVSHAWTGLLAQLTAGRGPDRFVRAYVCTAVRHAAYERTRKARRLVSLDDPTTAIPEPAVGAHDVTATADRTMTAAAFASLPRRWQAVLWATAVDGQSPADLAARFGISPNAVSALAKRARRALRVAYLHQHITTPDREPCRAIAAQLAAWTHRTLASRATAEVTEHLTRCPPCADRAAVLAEIDTTPGARTHPSTRPGGTTLASSHRRVGLTSSQEGQGTP